MAPMKDFACCGTTEPSVIQFSTNKALYTGPVSRDHVVGDLITLLDQETKKPKTWRVLAKEWVYCDERIPWIRLYVEQVSMAILAQEAGGFSMSAVA